MPRAFHIPSVAFLFCAFALSFLASISLPYLTGLDIVHTTFAGPSSEAEALQGALQELRYGTWAFCSYTVGGVRTCSPAANGYSTTVYNSDKTSWQTVGIAWTRGLAVHPVAAGIALVAFLLSLSTNVTFMLLAALVSFLAAILALVSFAIDIALYVFVKHEMAKLVGVIEHTHTGPAFWMTFVSFILLCVAGCTVCVGRRRDRMSGSTSYNMASKVSWRDRFRRQA